MDNATDNAMHQHRHEGSDYRRIELITGLSRRRRWTADEKAAIVTESLQPGVNISELARLWGVNRGLLQTWRRAMIREGETSAAEFVPLRRAEDLLSPDTSAPAVPDPPLKTVATNHVEAQGTIEIEGAGLRIRFSGPLDVGALQVVLAHVGLRR
jgi:transposase